MPRPTSVKLWWSFQRKAHYLVVYLPPSDDAFVKARRPGAQRSVGTSAACQHRQHDLGGGEILGGGRRKRTRVFSEQRTIYSRFGRPGKGDKGKVEGLVGYARRNFMVPAPRSKLGSVNEQLEAQCLIVSGAAAAHRND